MKIIILIFILCLLCGCRIYDLTNFTVPNDTRFLALIESLDTPKKIVEYMGSFEWNVSFHTYSPYEMYLANLEGWDDTGDCDDFAAFGAYAANWHGYITYRMTMWVKTQIFYGLPLVLPHVICIYVEDGKYTYSNNSNYIPIFTDTFQNIINDYLERSPDVRSIVSWKVYDYDMNLVEGGK